MKLIAAFLLLATSAFAQASHSAVLTWTASVDAGTTGAYVNVYKAVVACSTSATFTLLATKVSGTTYTDSTVGAGAVCYYVTEVAGGVESAPSNQWGTTINPLPPTALSGTGK